MNFDPPKRIVLGLIVAAVIALVMLRAAEDREPARPTSPSIAGSTPATGSDTPMSAPGSTASDPSAADAHETSPQALTATKPETPSAHSAGSTGSVGTEGQPDESSDDDDAESEPPPRTIWSADMAGISGAVAENLHELKSCYEQWLRLDPDIAGRVVIEFAIQTVDADEPEAPRAEDGTALALIEELGLVSTVDHAFMEGCVSSVFADLWFSPPDDGRMEVTYPLVFSNPD